MHLLRGPTIIDIRALAPVARDAFARAVNEHRVPLARRKRSGVLLAALVGALVLAAIMCWGFGDPGNPRSGQGLAWLILYLAGSVGVTGGLLAYARNKALARRLGCPPGVYVIGSRLVDACARQLRVFPLFGSQPRIIHTTLHWHGFTFAFASPDDAQDALDEFVATTSALREAFAADDVARLLELDPMGIGLTLSGSASRSAPAASRRSHAIVALASAALATSAWLVRNDASMEAAYDRIHTSQEAYAWIDRGGDRERGERKAMEVELAGVDRSRIDQMRAILARYPDAPAELRRPVEEALHRRYQAARVEALELASSPQLRAFIDQVYAGLEAGSVEPVMQVVVARTDNSALEKLDASIAADPELKETVAPVAAYFAASDATLSKAIIDGLHKLFPPDVMELTDNPGKGRARIDVFYTIRPKLSGDGISLYSEVDKRGTPVPNAVRFPGIELELGAELVIPGAAPQRVTFTATPEPQLTVHGTHSLDSAQVYGAMAASAYEDLKDKLLRALSGQSDLDAPARDGSCAALRAKLAELEACRTLAPDVRADVMTTVNKVVNATSVTIGDNACKRTDALVTEALTRARCTRGQ